MMEAAGVTEELKARDPMRWVGLMNTLYIVALRRFEAELISGISIPIPALTYTQVKRDLQELIEKK